MTAVMVRVSGEAKWWTTWYNTRSEALYAAQVARLYGFHAEVI